MSGSERAPLGAETPDEVLVAYVNGSLSDAERLEADRWLAEHPQWRARLDAYGAIGGAVRRGRADPAPAPDIAALGGLWAAIDAGPPRAPAPLPPPTPKPTPSRAMPPPPATDVVSIASRRRTGTPRWLLAAAAAAVVMVGGGVVALTRGDTDDQDGSAADEGPAATANFEDQPDDTEGETGAMPEATPPPDQLIPAPDPGDADSVDRDAMGAVRDAADATVDGDTATFTQVVTATLDVTGTPLEDTAQGTPQVLVAAGGDIEFPDTVALSGSVRYEGGINPEAPDSFAIVERDGATFVRCTDEPDFTEIDVADAACVSPVGTSIAGLPEVLDTLISGDASAERLEDDLELDEDVARYEVETDLSVDAGSVPATMTVTVDADGRLEDVVVVFSDEIPVAVTGGDVVQVPADVEVRYTLLAIDVPVEIPAVD